MTTPHRFWMVKGAGPTNYRHDTRAEAEAEAERLARCSPGECFYVLEAVTAHIRRDVERIKLGPDRDADLPF